MNNLNINTGEIRLTVNDDSNRIVQFNPKDELFTEKFYRLMRNFQDKQREMEPRAKLVESNNTTDEYGIPLNVEERFALTKELCLYAREQIDIVFGQGTSQIAFGDSLVVESIIQFFNGITPFISEARSEKVDKYLPKKTKPRGKK